MATPDAPGDSYFQSNSPFQTMEQLDILRCAFSANAKISFVSKLVCVAYSVLWRNKLLLVKKVVFSTIIFLF
jgi:hypothetical protein